MSRTIWRGPDGRFTRCPWEIRCIEQHSIEEEFARRLGDGRVPRLYKENLLLARVHFRQDASAVSRLVEMNRNLIRTMAEDKGRMAGPQAVEALEAGLLEYLPHLIRRWDHQKGSLTMWLSYKLALKSISLRRAYAQKFNREASAFEAHSRDLSEAVRHHSDVEAIQRRAEASVSLGVIEGTLREPEYWDGPEWIICSLMVNGVTDEPDIAFWTGLPRKTVGVLMQKVRLKLMEDERIAA